MKKALSFIFLIGCFLFLVSPIVVFGQAVGGPAGGAPAVGGPIGPAGTNSIVAIPNPLGDTNSDADPRIIIGRIIAGVLGIVGSLALAIFVYGGLTWMTSGGNQSRVEKGKEMIVWAVLGLGIIFFSYAIVTFIISAFFTTAKPAAGI